MPRMRTCFAVLTIALTPLGIVGCPTASPIGGPAMNAVPLAFNFEADDTTATLTISNVGQNVLTWIIANAPPWLTVTPQQGVGDTVVTLTVDRTGLAVGTYNGTFIIASNGGSQQAAVTLAVAGPPLPPTLAVSPALLAFGDSLTTQTFEVQNAGTGTVTWSLAESADWITPTPSPSAGAATSDTPDTVTVSVDRSAVLPGSYTADITVTNTDTAATETVTVTMDVPGPSGELTVTPTILDFGTNTVQLNFSIWNRGTAAVDWTLTEAMAWLAVTDSLANPIAGGNLPAGNQITLTATVTRDAVTTPPANSPFSGIMTVTDVGTGSPINIAVSMEVLPPELEVVPDTLNFGSFATNKLIAIRNPGLGTVNWSIDTTGLPAWLEDDASVPLVVPAAGDVTNETDGVLVSVNRSPGGGPLLAPGNYTFDLQITSDAGNATVTVNMSVAVVPILNVDTGSVDLDGQPLLEFGTESSVETFTINNAGTGTLDWEINVDEFPDWLTFDRASGSNTTGTTTITATVDRSQLSAGGYFETAAVTSNGGNVLIEITLQVPLRPVISVSPNALDFGMTGDTSSFAVANIGDPGTILNFLVVSDKEWLFNSPTNGVSFGVSGPIKDWQGINVAIDRGGLDSTGATGQFTVYALDSAGNIMPDVEEQTVTVSVEASPLSFETSIARKRIPSMLRFAFIMRDIRDRAFVIAPDVVPDAFTMYEKDVPVEEPTETTLFLLAQNSLVTEPLTDVRMDLKVNVVLLLDYSGSMENSAQQIGRTIQDVYEEVGERFIDDFFANFVNAEPNMVKMAVMEFHDRDVSARLVQDFTNDPATLVAAIQGINITDNGATVLLPALEEAAATLAGEDSPLIPFDDGDLRIIMHLGDGRLTTPPDEIQDTVDYLQGLKVRGSSVGWGLDLNSEPLARVASMTGGHYYPTLLDGAGLPVVATFLDRVNLAADELASHMVLSYTALNEEENVAVRFDGAFDDPNDDPNQGIIEGSLDEQNLNLEEIVGDNRLGQISIRSTGVQPGNTAQVTIRAEFVPRNVNKFTFTVASPRAFTATPTPQAEGGIVEGWSLVEGPVGTFALTSPDVLPYGAFGDLIQLDFGATGAVPFIVTLTVDNTIYGVDPEPKYFVFPDSIQVDTPKTVAPAFPTPFVDPSFLNFGTAVDAATLDIANIGGSYIYPPPDLRRVELEWEILDEPFFIDVAPDEGVQSTTIGADTVNVTADRTVNDGTYIDYITIFWTAGSVNVAGTVLVPVSITVLPAALTANPTTVNIPIADTDGTFDITNTGQSTLQWSIDTTGLPAWITAVSPVTGLTTDETETITVDVDRTGLVGPGTVSHVLTITNLNDYTTQNVTINMDY